MPEISKFRTGYLAKTAHNVVNAYSSQEGGQLQPGVAHKAAELLQQGFIAPVPQFSSTHARSAHRLLTPQEAAAERDKAYFMVKLVGELAMQQHATQSSRISNPGLDALNRAFTLSQQSHEHYQQQHQRETAIREVKERAAQYRQKNFVEKRFSKWIEGFTAWRERRQAASNGTAAYQPQEDLGRRGQKNIVDIADLREQRQRNQQDTQRRA